ncbi:unnamed protein product [Clavelina lepadiformis]|uniref:Aminopeptidase n=1 Tax=Clavelina lepadiformis TaxID=159417 RepID=A0ABP0F4U6_CLALP
MGTQSDEEEQKLRVSVRKAALVAWIIVTICLLIVVIALSIVLAEKTTSKPSNETAVKKNPNKSSASDFPPVPWSSLRLPKNITPYHYVIDLQPHLTPGPNGTFIFNGTSSVEFVVTNSTKYVILHSKKLVYSAVTLFNDEGQNVTSNHKLYKKHQYLIVEAKTDLEAGRHYNLTTEFYGNLSDDNAGLYRGNYTNTAGETIVMASSQLESTEARKVFPCFDEPALKATFDVFLRHKDPNYALSNMPNISTEVMQHGWKRTRFDRTPKMSTYLLAFVVCRFDYVEQEGVKYDYQTRVFARPSEIAKGNGDYASKVAPAVLKYFEESLNVSYKLPKSDQIAVPHFNSGAMENWGLVIYRETALLYNPDINSAFNKRRVATVIAHELAHQWFGNLVSPQWWNELWLNEGFASYFEYLGVNAVEPSWKIHDQFVMLDMHRAMLTDGYTSSRPIVSDNIETPSQIRSIFDAISYSKGACILRMINEFMGDEAFFLGLKNYLEELSYSSANHSQLFHYWEQALESLSVSQANRPPGNFLDSMNTWVLQNGLPVVTAERESATSTNVVLRQERFLVKPTQNMTSAENSSYSWAIPFWYATQGNLHKNLKWINKNSSVDEITVPVDKYFIGNYEAFGYYRVNYDQRNWESIVEQLHLDHTVINVKSRGQLLDDAFNLARSKRLGYDTAFRLTTFLRNDLDYVTWECALEATAHIPSILERSETYGLYRKYLSYLVEPLYNDVTWTDDGGQQRQFQRANAIGVACANGNKHCVETAGKLFKEWQTTGVNKISPILKYITYCTAISAGGEEEWDFAWERYLNESNSQEKLKVGYALTCTTISWIAQRFLNRIVNDTYVKKQDASFFLRYLCYKEATRDITWRFIQQEWDYLYNTYGKGLFSFSGIIYACTGKFSTKIELQQLEDFQKAKSDQLGSASAVVDGSIERAKTYIQWREDHEETVHNWLKTEVERIKSA